MKLKIATRKSKLALIQTEQMIALIKEKFGIECEMIPMMTEGDRRLDIKLDSIGGKGLFIKDIERYLLDGYADAAVHSLKDVPWLMDDSFEIAAMPVREDVRDAFIGKSGISFFDLPPGARVGTGSARRSSQMEQVKPDIVLVPIRGNIQTRIEKMQTEELDGIILAVAGIKRLGLEHIITNYFDPTIFIPAVGQGAIGIEIVKDSPHASIFKGLDNRDVRMCVESERNFMKKLNGNCSSSLGAYSTLSGERMNITGFYKMADKLVQKEISGCKCDYLRLGEALAEKILMDGL